MTVDNDDEDRKERRDRLSAATEREFMPSSLVGSFFHSDAERGWQGCVVAEPAPGMYLVETFDWVLGMDSTGQMLVRLDDMAGWTFYDAAEWMRNADEHGGVRERWDRERKETKGPK
jgi:hypothetical protein